MRISTPSVLLGSLLTLGLGCAKSDGSGGTGGDNGSGGSPAGSGGTGAGTGGVGTGGDAAKGGSSGTGGTTGTGGDAAKGGSSGSGGTTGTGGDAAKGGSSGSGGATGTGGAGTSCTFTQSSTKSSKIGTVGIVTWSTTLPSPTSASINFGLTTSYGMTAPVDLTTLTQTNYRTLLLGMKASKTYHYQISAASSSGTCTSDDYTIATGALPNGGLPQFTSLKTNNKAALYGGFLVVGSYQGSTIQSFILDVDGDFVWWYADGSDGCGTRMSYDGNYMWINNGNVVMAPMVESPHVHRVTMDGMTDTDFSTAFDKETHQLTPLPDGSVAFYATGANGCDDIKLFPAGGTPNSTATTLVNSRTAHGGNAACHLNNIEYSAMDDTLVFSDLDNNCLTKISRTTGATVWILNGGANGITSSFTGDSWKGGEHGFHILGLDDFVIFNNNSAMDPTGGGPFAGNNSGSMAIEMKLNLTAMTAAKSWSYTANPAISDSVLGDVQRMTTNGPNGSGNGNTVVNYGLGDTIQEIDANGNVLQEIKSQYPFGFMEKRATLYGPPTR